MVENKGTWVPAGHLGHPSTRQRRIEEFAPQTSSSWGRAQLHSSPLSFIVLFEEGSSREKFESQGTLSIWCTNLSNVGVETLMDRWMEGTYGFLKPKYLFSFQDLSLGKNKPPFQNLRSRIYFNICRRILIFSFSRFSLAN